MSASRSLARRNYLSRMKMAFVFLWFCLFVFLSFYPFVFLSSCLFGREQLSITNENVSHHDCLLVFFPFFPLYSFVFFLFPLFFVFLSSCLFSTDNPSITNLNVSHHNCLLELSKEDWRAVHGDLLPLPTKMYHKKIQIFEDKFSLLKSLAWKKYIIQFLGGLSPTC